MWAAMDEKATKKSSGSSAVAASRARSPAALGARTAAKSSADLVRAKPSRSTPAAWTTPVSGPNSSRTAASPAARASGSETSTLRWSRRSSRSAGRSLRPSRTTRASPRDSSRPATARPSPPAPPVTTYTPPSRTATGAAAGAGSARGIRRPRAVWATSGSRPWPDSSPASASASATSSARPTACTSRSGFSARTVRAKAASAARSGRGPSVSWRCSSRTRTGAVGRAVRSVRTTCSACSGAGSSTRTTSGAVAGARSRLTVPKPRAVRCAASSAPRAASAVTTAAVPPRGVPVGSAGAAVQRRTSRADSRRSPRTRTARSCSRTRTWPWGSTTVRSACAVRSPSRPAVTWTWPGPVRGACTVSSPKASGRKPPALSP